MAVAVMAQQPSGLTPRECEVLALVALGLTSQGIANRLGTSVQTVRTQVQSALYKLGARSRAQAVLLAHEFGILQTWDSKPD